MSKTAKTVGEEVPDKLSIKAQKERDAEDAMRAYRQEQMAVRERMEQLRALRLEREAQLAAAAAARKPIEPAQVTTRAAPAKAVKKTAKKTPGVRVARGR
jgi:hypothetical protein